MRVFLSGGLVMACLIAALFFWRYWTDSRDRLFLFFAASFAIESVNRAVFAWLGGQAATEYQLGYVLARLLSFLLIIVAIIDKNASRRA